MDVSVAASFDEAIIEAAEAVIAGRCPADVLRTAYDGADADALAHLAPDEQLAAVRLVERLNTPGLVSVLVLLAALRKTSGGDAWLHFNLVKHLNKLIVDGAHGAHLPAIIHAKLALEGLNQAASATAFLHSVLARELSPISPREAVLHGMRAARHGHAIGTTRSAFVALGVEPLSGRPTPPQVIRIAKELNFAPDDLPKTTSTDRASGRQTVVVEAPQRITYPPVGGDGSHYIFARSGLENDLPGISVHTFQAGTFSIDATARGLERHYVFDREGDCVLDLANGVDPFIAETIMECDGPVAILNDSFSGAMNICHFLLDNLTRVPIYERASAHPMRFFTVDGDPYYRTIFDRLGMTDRIIIPAEKRVSIRAPELLFSSNIASDHRHPAHECVPWAIDYLRSAFGVDNGPTTIRRKLLISRADAKGRAVVNWEELLPTFRRHGFETVELAGMEVEGQIDLFRHASHVVGVHGAGLTNILFAPRDCVVLEILPPLVATRAYWLLASSIGQRYSAVIADDATGIPRPDYRTWRHDASHNGRDIRLPVRRLESALAEMQPARTYR